MGDLMDVVIEKLDGEKSELDETTKNCVHEIVRPANYEVRLPPDTSAPNYEPARKFAYPLDPFQKAAIECIELNESVLVAAHTSAGKTTVAEYAIALALKNQSRVIYTAPIKALSNQKFRDLQEQFQDVGLMTGDVTLNPSASCIIMTTEILRSILYRGSELVREVKWVIFDEIHYMRDRDRGVIWEETIVLLPDSVRQVFLSATIPNTLEFAEWICRTKHQPCHVVSTNFRPTPLRHFLFPSGGDGLVMIMNEHRVFQNENYQTVLQQLSNIDANDATGAPASKAKRRKRNQQAGEDDLARILAMCNEKKLTPVIVFAFSKKEVEENASVINSLDLTTEQEKADIRKIYDSAVSTLAQEDQTLPQVQGILPHLLKGIGIHHGGLLPMVKEVIEIMFQELLIKVLFSTETFSMGINMPARTVIFTGLHKFDGKQKRMISPGEYIQMSGRAGRRGIDSKGFSIVLLKAKPTGSNAQSVEDASANVQGDGEDELKNLFTGEAFRLDSHFYMKYNTILNLTRVEGASPEYMIKRSLLQFQTQRNTITLEERVKVLQQQLDSETVEMLLTEICQKCHLDDTSDWRQILPAAIRHESEDSIECAIVDYTESCSAWRKYNHLVTKLLLSDSVNVAKFLQRGRVIRVVERSFERSQSSEGIEPELGDAARDRHWGYGVIVNLVTKALGRTGGVEIFVDVVLRTANALSRGGVISLDAMVPHESGRVERTILLGLHNFIDKSNPQFEVFRVPLNSVVGITKMKLKMDDQTDKQCDEYRLKIGLKLMGLLCKQPVLQTLDPIKDMNLHATTASPTGLGNVYEEMMKIETNIKTFDLYGSQWVGEILEAYQKRVNYANEIQRIQTQLQSNEHPRNVVQLRSMTDVLRKLEYLDSNDVITIKGKVCCDISTVDTLVMGELLFGYADMQTLTPDYLCSLISVLVHEEPVKIQLHLDDAKLQILYDQVVSVAKRVAEVSVKCGLDIDPAAYLAKFTSALMVPARDWVRGVSFGEIMSEHPHLYEGTVVRSFRRLEEALREGALSRTIARELYSRRVCISENIGNGNIIFNLTNLKSHTRVHDQQATPQMGSATLNVSQSIIDMGEGVAIKILEIEEEITRRLAFEDLLWLLFRQIWTNHWELNIDLVCWLDDCRTAEEVDCAVDIAKDFWSTIGHLRKLIVDDMMNNGQAINQLVNQRREEYKNLQQVILPAHQDVTEAKPMYLLCQQQSTLNKETREYFLALLDIGRQVDDMISASATSDRGELWTKSQKLFEHNDKVSEALIVNPLQALEEVGETKQSKLSELDQRFLERLAQVGRAKRAFSVPPYSLTEAEINGEHHPERSDRPDGNFVMSHVTGPMWLYAAAWSDSTRLLIPQIIAQALAVCARSSSELVDSNAIANAHSTYKFLTRDERPKLQRCSGAPCRPALFVKLEDQQNWRQWAREYGEPFETVLTDRLASIKTRQGQQNVETSDCSSVDLVRIRSMIIFQSTNAPQKPLDESFTKRWISTLDYLQEWFNLSNYLPACELKKTTSASAIYLISEKLPNQIAQKLVRMSKINPLLTKIIGYSIPAGVSILCRNMDHRYDPPLPQRQSFPQTHTSTISQRAPFRDMLKSTTNQPTQQGNLDLFRNEPKTAPSRPSSLRLEQNTATPPPVGSFRSFLPRSYEDEVQPPVVESSSIGEIDDRKALVDLPKSPSTPLLERAQLLRRAMQDPERNMLTSNSFTQTPPQLQNVVERPVKVEAAVQVNETDVSLEGKDVLSERLVEVLEEIKADVQLGPE